MSKPRNAIAGQPIDTTPDEERREAFVLAYFDTGHQAKAALIAGVHINTAAKWTREKWFADATKDLKRSLDRRMDGRISKILDKALDRLEDRIEHGDEKVLLTKTGVIRETQPISARDLAVVTGVLFDKRAAIRREPDQDDKAASALERIADKLRQYGATENRDALRDTATVDVEVREVETENATENEDLV
jgi:transposase